MKKTKLLQVRLTDSEDQLISQKMGEHSYKNRSEFVLNSIISLPKHDKKRSLGMIYEVNKIGVNLNQVVRRMHSNGRVDAELKSEIDSVFRLLSQIIETYQKL